MHCIAEEVLNLKAILFRAHSQKGLRPLAKRSFYLYLSLSVFEDTQHLSVAVEQILVASASI